MSSNSEVIELTNIVKQQQEQIAQLLKLFPNLQNLNLQPASPDKQEGVDTLLPADYNEELLTIAPDDKEVQRQIVSEDLVDVGEEAVAEDEPEEEVFTPGLKKDTSLMDAEVLEEGEGNGRGQRACARVPLSRTPRKNRFKDNPSFAKVDTVSFDKKVRTEDSIKAHQFIEKRPPATKVIVRCRECNRKFRIDAKLAPQRIDVGDTSSYQCDSCILRRKG